MAPENREVMENLIKIRKDVSLIKSILLAEGKLTPWAKKQLAKARAEKEGEYISLDNL